MTEILPAPPKVFEASSSSVGADGSWLTGASLTAPMLTLVASLSVFAPPLPVWPRSLMVAAMESEPLKLGLGA
ncbi:MAG: hypothetical protein AVDCRST_MAG85-3413 [uncultured Solirubrobacteraceae bacterium]|uniref:Uncharacterized protein n=1 Tax=uncultured Solirubrobacteraceae bacterium TaxID=1162706 RepID=A0A6J4TND3_9ACTN|nr:MAG: hypothetical protein AVDCRST_MAG85-3413 [uncultured Solirubrobacteraceae bacterium]